MEGGCPEVRTTHSLTYHPNLGPFRAKTTMNYTDYGGSAPHPQALTRRGKGGQLRTPKQSLADAGGGLYAKINISRTDQLQIKTAANKSLNDQIFPSTDRLKYHK